MEIVVIYCSTQLNLLEFFYEAQLGLQQSHFHQRHVNTITDSGIQLNL